MKFYIFLIFVIFFSSCSTSRVGENNYFRDGVLVPHDNEVYFGAFPNLGNSEHDVSLKKIENFEQLVHKKLAWVYMSCNWGEGIKFPKKEVDIINKAGSIAFIRLMPRSSNKQNGKIEEKKYSLQHIIDGEFDDRLREWARDAKNCGYPLLLDFAPEMTGFWFQWSGSLNGADKLDGYGDPNYPDGPERYRDAYRHIIDIFRDEHVDNITWFFHPDIQRLPNKWWNSAKYYYPGDDYIDWIGVSLYGVQNEKWGWITFSGTLAKWFDINIKDIASHKPVAVLEMGVTDGRKDGSKKEWLEDAVSTILDNPYVRFSAFTYWNENWITPTGTIAKLKVDSSEDSLETFRRLIKNKRIISKTYFNR